MYTTADVCVCVQTYVCGEAGKKRRMDRRGDKQKKELGEIIKNERPKMDNQPKRPKTTGNTFFVVAKLKLW